MSRKRRKADKTGRSVEGQYAQLDYAFLRSDAFRQLSGSAVKIFLELRARYNGHNNGLIALSLDECTRLFSIGKGTAQRSFQELKAKGFVRTAKLGRWYGRKASEWELTTLSRDGHLATHDWKNWKPEKALREAKKAATRYQDGYVECFEGSTSEPKH